MHACTHARTHTHMFNGPLCRTTWVSQYQKGKINLDFTEARDSECQWHQLGHMHCKSAPCSRQITTPAPHHSLFYRLDALTAAQPTASQHWRQYHMHVICNVLVMLSHKCFLFDTEQIELLCPCPRGAFWNTAMCPSVCPFICLYHGAAA